MLSVGPFQGDSAELSRFIQEVWQGYYLGKMAFPDWSAEYLEWQLRTQSPETRPYHLAAYDGSRLAGVLLGLSLAYRAEQTAIAGSLWSWLSIHPDYRGQRLAVQLDQERVRQMQEQEIDLITSFRFVGSRHSQAERPQAHSAAGKQFLRKVGFWVRILDPVRFQKWDLNRFEGWMGLLCYPFAGIPETATERQRIRPVHPQDLPRCLELMQANTAGMTLAVDWQAATLQQQLFGSPLSQTLVYENEGTIQGLVNFHLLPFWGRTPEPVGIIDLAAVQTMPHTAQVALLNAALSHMQNMGAIMCLKFNTGDVPASTMLHIRCMPKQADSYLVLQWVKQTVSVRPENPMHLLWR